MHGDYGFGAAVYQRLSAQRWPSHVQIRWAEGEADRLEPFRGCDRVIAIDALPPHMGKPGEILRLPHGSIPLDQPGGLGGGLFALLSTLFRVVRPSPRVDVLGPVAIYRAPFTPRLSPLVMAAVETVCANLRRELLL